MTERNGVEVGQHVIDLDGNDVGRVTALFDWAFAVGKGFPLLFRKEYVFGYAEVRGVKDGKLVVARSRDDHDRLARGGLPAAEYRGRDPGRG
jgi:hypothetical protein